MRERGGRSLRGKRDGLDVPDLVGVVHDGAVGAELAHLGGGRDGLLDPCGLVEVSLVNQALSLEVYDTLESASGSGGMQKQHVLTGVEVVGDEVVVAAADGVEEWLIDATIAEATLSNDLGDNGQSGRALLERSPGILVLVAETLDSGGKVTEEEDYDLNVSVEREMR